MSAYPPVEVQAYPPPAQNPAYPPAGQHFSQPPAYQPPPVQQQQATVVVTQQPVIVTTPVFRSYPVTVTDSNGQQVQTVLEYKAGILTFLVACILCLFLTEFGLCCIAIIPFFIKDLKDVYHITPTDGKVVGVYKRI